MFALPGLSVMLKIDASKRSNKWRITGTIPSGLSTLGAGSMGLPFNFPATYRGTDNAAITFRAFSAMLHYLGKLA